MSRGLPWWSIAPALALVACKIDASIGRDQLDAGGEGGGASMSIASESGATDGGDDGTGSGGGGGGEGGGEGGGTGDGSTAPSDESGTDDSGTGGVPLVCEHHDGDSACAVCRKGHCCDAIVTCHDHPGCFCYWDCLVEHVGEVEFCARTCAYEGHAFQDVVACQLDQCSEVCGDHIGDPAPNGD